MDDFVSTPPENQTNPLGNTPVNTPVPDSQPPSSPPPAKGLLARIWGADPVVLVLIVNATAAAGGAIAGYPTSPINWFNSYFIALLFFSFFCVLPMMPIAGLVHFVARRRHVAVTERALWFPSFIYAPVLAFAGYIMSFAFQMADNHESGSEFLPLILIYFGVTAFWVVPLITLVLNLVLIGRKKKDPQVPV